MDGLLFGDRVECSPQLQATNIAFNNISNNQMDISWNNGDGTNRIVVVKSRKYKLMHLRQIRMPIPQMQPLDQVMIWEQAILWFIMEREILLRLLDYQLEPTYHVRVFEYNYPGIVDDYMTATATGNPENQIRWLTSPLYRHQTSVCKC